MPEDNTLCLEDYKEFFDDTPVALIRTDIKTGKFLMANKYAATLFGFDSVEDLQENVRTTELYPAEDRKRLLQELKKHGNVENYEIQMKVNGKDLWLSACLRINCGGSCIEGSLADITELVELRNQQLMLLKEVGQKLDKKIAALAS